MYVRLVHPQPQPGQAEEYARRWQAILAPRARAIPCFRAAYFVGDRAAEAVHAIFVFVGDGRRKSRIGFSIRLALETTFVVNGIVRA